MSWLDKFWWFSVTLYPSLGTKNVEKLSMEERHAALRLLSITVLFFVLLSIAENWLFGKLGLEKSERAVLSFFTAFAAALVIARKLAEQIWPDLIQTADQNAAKRNSGKA